jgi:hypothetical protein
VNVIKIHKLASWSESRFCIKEYIWLKKTDILTLLYHKPKIWWQMNTSYAAYSCRIIIFLLNFLKRTCLFLIFYYLFYNQQILLM